MDKVRMKMEDLIVEFGNLTSDKLDNVLAIQNYFLERGRYEGLAAALSILRSSSVREEISRSNERLGIE